MISNTNRKKISIYGAIAFILSRMVDVITTWYYSPDLTYEANPLAVSWEHIFIITFILILTIMHHCYKLATTDYTKPIHGEWFLKLFLGSNFNTELKRYTLELSVLITAIIAGFLAASSWYFAHTLRLDSVNYFLGLKIGKLPLSMLAVVFLPWIISYNLLDRYFAKKYTQSH